MYYHSNCAIAQTKCVGFRRRLGGVLHLLGSPYVGTHLQNQPTVIFVVQYILPTYVSLHIKV